MSTAEPLTGLETDPKLAFDIRAFNTQNFNVERFLDRTRHSASLDEIHRDLRKCLQDIQSRMVTLINDDYTDFVKLSTSLHALHDAKQGLSSSQETSWGDYEKSTTESGKLVSLVTQKLDEIKKSRHDQFQKALQLARVTAVKNLHEDLKEKPRFAELFWLERVREHVAVLITTLFISVDFECSPLVSNFSKTLFENLKKHLFPFLEFQNSSSLKAKSLILDILIDIKAVEDSANFVTKTICPIPDFEGKSDSRMKTWIEIVEKKQKEIDTAISESDLPEKSKKKLLDFYKNCVFSSLISVFAEKIRPTLLPINPKIFRECFEMMSSFIQKTPDKLKFLDFWKTWAGDFPINGYIRYHSLNAIEKFRESLKMENLKILETPDGPVFETSANFLEIVKILLDDQVVLKNARHVFFAEVYKQLVDYLDWTEQLKEWTKHPAPNVHSGYVSKVDEFLKEVTRKATTSGWNLDMIQEIQFSALERSLKIFHTKASEVLDSVEQIGSSLLRLKKKQNPIPSENSAIETDEGKMKKQISLDIQFFLEITKEKEVFEEVTELLQNLLTRAETDL
ncbi:hypothetical protein FO519_005192 [Halicephalobus sp. NKZ332]|nr:hypothetical protein FO519_005192 [Halicephalobus sp. NKZ332]